MDKDLVVRNELCFTNDHSAPFWDFVSNCKLEDCPVFDDCPHKKSRGVKCGLGVGYMKRIEDIVMKNVDKLSPGQLFRIGTGLVPLYRLYFKLKMKELSLDDPLRSDGSVEPIYEAIAKYAMRIEKLWKSSGLCDADLGKIESTLNDANFYETMIEDD
jgi:hypothetical protein